jgi:hypothetical protein
MFVGYISRRLTSGYKESAITKQSFLPSRWRKDKEDGWRMDVAIDIESVINNKSDKDDKDKGDGDILEFGSDTEESDEELTDD